MLRPFVVTVRLLITCLTGALLAGACASTSEPLPFDDQRDPVVSFWMISPITDAATFAFRWEGDRLQYARSSESGLRFGDIAVQDCPLLGANLTLFQQSLLDSVEIAFGRAPRLPQTEVVMDSPRYRAKFMPERHGLSVVLEGFDDRGLPWVAAGHTVFDRISSCGVAD